MYYQLDNFYQNHRRYVKSVSFPQLRGENYTVAQLGDCDPILTNSDLGFKFAADKTTLLNPDGPANPCGLVAKSFFNDSFALYQQQNGGSYTNIDIH